MDAFSDQQPGMQNKCLGNHNDGIDDEMSRAEWLLENEETNWAHTVAQDEKNSVIFGMQRKLLSEYSRMYILV